MNLLGTAASAHESQNLGWGLVELWLCGSVSFILCYLCFTHISNHCNKIHEKSSINLPTTSKCRTATKQPTSDETSTHPLFCANFLSDMRAQRTWRLLVKRVKSRVNSVPAVGKASSVDPFVPWCKSIWIKRSVVACRSGVVTSRVKVPLWFRKGDEIDGGVANLLLIKEPLNDSDRKSWMGKLWRSCWLTHTPRW